MAKVSIKPTRSFFHDNQLFSVNKTVKVEEKDAELLVKNGWAVLTESKPKAAKTEDDKTDEDAISGSLMMIPRLKCPKIPTTLIC